MKKKFLNKSNILNRMTRYIKRSILILLVLVTPVLVFAEQEETFDDIDETIEVGKGLEIMPNLEGSEFEIVEVEKEEQETPEMAPRIALFAAPSGGPHFGNFKGKSGTTVNLYKNASDSSAYTYIEPTAASSGVVPILDQTSSMYKIAIAGFEGWISKNSLDLVTYDQAKGNDYYQVNSSGDLIHYISRGTGSTSYSVINQGKGPSYLDPKKRFISYDGHYFYEDSKLGLKNLIKDYNDKTRKQAVNSNNPFYNYFQYLPARTQTKLTANDFKRYLLSSNSNYSNPFNSALAETEQLFIDNANIFGGNGALAFASAVHESGWGTSYFAKGRNNFFGHNAYDSAPGMASRYNSPNTGIATHFGRFLNWNYLDSNPNNGIYYGGFVGNKNLGMNVKYASDPYWGEKIAAHYYNMDKLAGGKDYKLYTIGITKKANEKVYKSTNTSSGSPYYFKHEGIPVAITKEVKSGNTTWFQHTSEALLNNNKDREPWASNLSKIYYPFDMAKSQLYIESGKLEIISRAGNAGDLNNDFDITGADMARLQANLRKIYSLSAEQKRAADLSGDGEITGADMARLEAHLRKKYVIYGNTNQLTKQSNPKTKTAPKFDEKSTTVYALDDVKLYPDWSTDYSAILSISKGTELTGVPTDNGWLHVLFEHSNGYDYIGYVSLGKVSASKDGKVIEKLEIVEPEEVTLPEPGKITYIVNAEKGLNLREGPSTSDASIELLEDKSEVLGGKPLNGWVYIEFQGLSGFVSADFIKEKN